MVFGKYGTFTGPGIDRNFRDNDNFSLDKFSGYFNLDDVSMVLVNTAESPADYVYMHLSGTSTSTVTLERSTGPIPSFYVEANRTYFSGKVDVTGNVDIGGKCTASDFSANSKSFNIPHPLKSNKRLWHGCLEGPEHGVYVRGRLTNNNVIDLPDYWSELVDPETITVSLTQIGYSQDLIVEKIEWGQKVIIKSNNGSNIDCYYTVNATRKDIPPLQVEQDP